MVVEVERRSGKDRRTEQLPPPGGLALRSGVERRVDVALPEHQPASREFSPELVRRAVVEAVTRGHDIRAHEVVLIKPGAIPKTSSGKIQRRACRAAYLKGELELIEP